MGDVFDAFAGKMRNKFHEALGKYPDRSPAPWQDYDLGFLLDRLLEEVEELCGGFPIIDWTLYKSRRDDIISHLKHHGKAEGESIDVGNFTLFIDKQLNNDSNINVVSVGNADAVSSDIKAEELEYLPGFSVNMKGKLSLMTNEEAMKALEDAVRAIQANRCCQYYVSVHFAVKDEGRRGKLSVACLDQQASHIEEKTVAETMQRIRRDLQAKKGGCP